jgi:hypothetical protein
MTCHGCIFTKCAGMDCPELKNMAAIINAITHRLQANTPTQTPAGNSSSSPTGTRSPKPVEECQ